MFYVNPKGQLLYMSKSFPGALNDAQISSFADEKVKLSKFETIMGDKGFPNLKMLYPSVLIPQSRRNKVPLTKLQKSKNAKISSVRIIVENYFASLKANRILQHTFRAKGDLDSILEYHHTIWVVIAAIYKFYILNLQVCVN